MSKATMIVPYVGQGRPISHQLFWGNKSGQVYHVARTETDMTIINCVTQVTG